MSGITGFYRLNHAVANQADLASMMYAIRHRGPDGSTSWSERAIALGYHMLHTTPESLHEAFPVVGANGNIILVADARIDNREELINVLKARHRSTDSELILAAYERWGRGCPDKLIGDFAFAIWDRNEQLLFCARDQAGVRPFYYYHAPGKLFAFGSEIKALLQLREVPCQVNEVKVADHLGLVFLDDTDTFYKNIFRLSPGHTLTVSPTRLRLHRYWSLDPSKVLHLSSDEEYAEAFLEVFEEAVRCRMRSSRPIGSLLSGGLDSSSITCVARKFAAGNNESLKTFSLIYDEVKECDERDYINAVLKQGHIESHFVQGDLIRPISDLPDILDALDEPHVGHTMSSVWRIYDAVSQEGVRVVLDGHGGDETVSHGGEYVHHLARNRQWLPLATELRGSARHGEISYSNAVSFFKNHLFKYGPRPLKMSRAAFRLAQRALSNVALTSDRASGIKSTQGNFQRLVAPGLERRVQLHQRYQAYKKEKEATSALGPQEHHYRILTLALQPWAMESYDKMGAVHGVEIRFPFRDKRLMEFCLSLPPEQKRNQGWGRLVLRRAMKGILPTEVQWRANKNVFGPVLLHGVRSDNFTLLDELLKAHEVLDKYVDLTLYNELCEKVALAKGQITDQDMNDFLKATSLATWLRSVASKKNVHQHEFQESDL